MFRNWRSIFTGDGGPINARIPIYSFDGRDVLADPFWSVSLIDYFIGCLVLYVLLYSPFVPSIRQAPEEHLARLHQQGSPSAGQTLWDVAGGPHVGHGPVVEPDLGSAPGPADAELLQPVHRSLHRDPQEHLKPLPRTTPPTKPIPAASTLGGGGKTCSSFFPHIFGATCNISRTTFKQPEDH